MVSILFRNLLHKNDCKIVFAERGDTFSDKSLRESIEKAKTNFFHKHNITNEKQIEIIKSQPTKHIGLQIVDYYLWALQKLYEKNDSSFFEILKDDFKLVIDRDDKRKNEYGEYYDKKNILSMDKIIGS